MKRLEICYIRMFLFYLQITIIILKNKNMLSPRCDMSIYN